MKYYATVYGRRVTVCCVHVVWVGEWLCVDWEMYVCSLYICLSTRMYISVSIYIYLSIYPSIFRRMYVRIYIYIYIYKHVYTHVCVCIRTDLNGLESVYYSASILILSFKKRLLLPSSRFTPLISCTSWFLVRAACPAPHLCTPTVKVLPCSILSIFSRKEV
jgi:hypothetical protein